MAPTTILSVQDLTKFYGSEQIFSKVSFQLAEREHVALVGVNGAGKSTILRIVADIESADQGRIISANGTRITYLPQEAKFASNRTVLEEARHAFEPVLIDAERMRSIEDRLSSAIDAEMDALLEEYDRLLHRFEIHGGYDIEHRSEEVLSGLGFSDDQFDEPVRRLSGGQKTRVALAKALLADPDLLLLDEPTNHLDLVMLEWLETFLRGWGGACLVVSHDRYFLDRVTTRTLEVAFGSLEDYPAPYTGYLKLRQERRARKMKEFEEQQEYIARTEEFIRRYKAGQRSREARGRQTRLERLERIERPQDQQDLNIRIGSTVRSGNSVLKTTPLEIGYRPTGDHQNAPVRLLSTKDLLIERGDRVGLIGPNGGGKTTLLRSLTGEIPLLKGRFELGTNVKVGYYAQAHEQLPADGTPLSIVLSSQPMGEESARNYLGRFLFSGDDVFKPIAGLSGGERSRLALAMLLLQQANFLILDEPTNHLDISARESLEEMLRAFDGTILFVSHDRYFVDRIATRIWAIENDRLINSLGNYTDYQRSKGQIAEATKAEAPPRPAEPVASPPAEETRHPDRRGKSDSRLQKSVGQIEREIGRLEGRLNELSDALAIAGVDQDFERMATLSEELDDVQNELDAAYERWEDVSSELHEVLSGAPVS
jgi:ATP-binding cassette, subfamily F, member 3